MRIEFRCRTWPTCGPLEQEFKPDRRTLRHAVAAVACRAQPQTPGDLRLARRTRAAGVAVAAARRRPATPTSSLVISNHTNNARARHRSQGIPFFHVPMSPATEARRPKRAELRPLSRVPTSTRSSSRAICRCCRPISWRATRPRSSTSTTASCRRSSAPTRTRRPTTAASSSSAPPPTTSPKTWTPARSSSRTCVRIDHRHDADDLRRMGRYIERVVLARAVSWHVEDRVLLHGNKTIVFS